MSEVKNRDKTRMRARRGLADRIVVRKEGKNDELLGKRPANHTYPLKAQGAKSPIV